jgi:hypothetical protein
MEPATYNFTIYQGTTFERQMTYKTTAGVVVALAAYHVRMKLRKTWGGTVLLSLSDAPGGGIAVTNVSPNITLTITVAQTTALNFEFAVYDMEIESPAGAVDRLIEGRITLKKEITA